MKKKTQKEKIIELLYKIGKERGFKKENWKNYYYELKKAPERKLL